MFYFNSAHAAAWLDDHRGEATAADSELEDAARTTRQRDTLLRVLATSARIPGEARTEKLLRGQ